MDFTHITNDPTQAAKQILAEYQEDCDFGKIFLHNDVFYFCPDFAAKNDLTQKKYVCCRYPHIPPTQRLY